MPGACFIAVSRSFTQAQSVSRNAMQHTHARVVLVCSCDHADAISRAARHLQAEAEPPAPRLCCRIGRANESKELRQLLAMAAPAPEAGTDLGSTTRLSPVRASVSQQRVLGSAKVRL